MSQDRHERDPRLVRGLGLIYRFALSPILHGTQRVLTGSAGACRFQPTCSEYASIAFHVHGPIRGGWLAIKRVLRCHPFAKGGFDAVPYGETEVSANTVATNTLAAPLEAPAHLP